HTISNRDWSSDVCSSDLCLLGQLGEQLFEGLHGLFPRPTVPFQGKRFARPPVTRRGTLVRECRVGHTMRRATALTKKRVRIFKRPSAVLYWAPGTTCERPAIQVWRESRTMCSLATKANSGRPRSWTPRVMSVRTKPGRTTVTCMPRGRISAATL